MDYYDEPYHIALSNGYVYPHPESDEYWDDEDDFSNEKDEWSEYKYTSPTYSDKDDTTASVKKNSVRNPCNKDSIENEWGLPYMENIVLVKTA